MRLAARCAIGVRPGASMPQRRRRAARARFSPNFAESWRIYWTTPSVSLYYVEPKVLVLRRVGLCLHIFYFSLSRRARGFGSWENLLFPFVFYRFSLHECLSCFLFILISLVGFVGVEFQNFWAWGLGRCCDSCLLFLYFDRTLLDPICLLPCFYLRLFSSDLSMFCF